MQFDARSNVRRADRVSAVLGCLAPIAEPMSKEAEFSRWIDQIPRRLGAVVSPLASAVPRRALAQDDAAVGPNRPRLWLDGVATRTQTAIWSDRTERLRTV